MQVYMCSVAVPQRLRVVPVRRVVQVRKPLNVRNDISKVVGEFIGMFVFFTSTLNYLHYKQYTRKKK